MLSASIIVPSSICPLTSPCLQKSINKINPQKEQIGNIPHLDSFSCRKPSPCFLFQNFLQRYIHCVKLLLHDFEPKTKNSFQFLIIASQNVQYN